MVAVGSIEINRCSSSFLHFSLKTEVDGISFFVYDKKKILLKNQSILPVNKDHRKTSYFKVNYMMINLYRIKSEKIILIRKAIY
jgi:hypothetical protein